MNCTVRENLDKVLNNSLGVKEGQKVSPSLAELIEIKIDALKQQFTLYDYTGDFATIENGVLKYNQEELNKLETLIDKYEEEFIEDYENRDSGIGDLISNYDLAEQEVEANPELHTVDIHEIKVNNSLLFNPVTNGATPKNLVEWLESRVSLRDSLKALHTSLLKEGYSKNSEKINKLNKIIQDLNTELESLNVKDPANVYNSVSQEVLKLSTLLKSAALDPVNSAIEFETSQVRDRINTLMKFFLGRDMIGNLIDKDDPDSPGVLLYRKVEDMFDLDGYNKLSKSITDLSDLYEIKVKDIIKGTIENNALVKEHVKNKEEWTQVNYILKPKENGYELVQDSSGVNILEILKQYLDNDLVGDVTAFSSFLGAASGGGILGDILHNIKSGLYNNEVGNTSSFRNKVDAIWKKVKDRKDTIGGRTDFAYKKLFRKDVNGVRVNSLASAYSDEFFEDYKVIADARRGFFQNMKDESLYSLWMEAEASTTTKIDPRMLSVAKERFKGTKYEKHFKSDSEIEAYEEKLKKAIGETMFEIETKKAIQKLSDYTEQEENKSFTYLQEHTFNPFTFIDHFEANKHHIIGKDPSTGMFLFPEYVHSIPSINKSVVYNNKDFYDEIEGDNDLKELWTGLYQILEYTNPFLKSEGLQVGMLELPQYEDILDREVLQDLRWFQRISPNLKSLWLNFKNSFYDHFFDKESSGEDDTQQGKKINLYYSTSMKNSKRKLVRLYMQNSLEVLEDIALKNGLVVDIDFEDSEGEPLSYREIAAKKRVIANSIAQKQLNTVTSSNIVDTIFKLTDVVNNAKARHNTLGVYNLFLDYSRKSKLRGNSYVYDYLKTWGETNIIKKKHADSAKILGVGETSITKIRIPFLPKNYNEAEKKVVDAILAMKFSGSRDFTGIDVSEEDSDEKKILFSSKGKYVIKDDNGVETSITSMEAEALFTKYLDKMMNELGVNATIGSITQGLAGNIARTILSLSFKGGISNRQVGHLANLQLAASERYGFNEENLHQARRFLMFTNAMKYWEMLKNPLTNNKYRNKYTLSKAANVETVKMFVESLSMLQNKADELSLENRFGNSPIAVFTNNLKSFLTDFNINNPEWHNQTEVILAVLANTEVITKTGESKKFFDGTTTIFKPGTLELKEEFDTLENKRMWIDFKYDEEGRNDHVTAVANISASKEASQGNYNPEDLMPFKATLTGKILSMFNNYLPENIKHNWGYKKVDLRTGQIDFKGSKLELIRHVPTLGVYLTMINTGRFVTLLGTASTIGLSTAMIPLAIPSLIGAGLFAYLLKNNMSKPVAMSKKEFLLAADFAIEVGKRSANTFARRFSGGLVGLSQEFLDEKFVIENENLTEQERTLLSESAQAVANKFLIYTGYLTTAIILKSLYIMCMMGSDDDDEERLHKLKQLDGALNTLQNIRENVNTDIEMYTSPSQLGDKFVDVFTSGIFVKNTIGWVQDMAKVYDQYNQGTKHGGDLVNAWLKAPIVPIPKSISKMIFTDSGLDGFYTDSRVFREPGDPPKNFLGDDIVKEKGLKNEEIITEDFKKSRTVLRNKVKREIETKIRKESKIPDYKVSEETKKLTDKFMKPLNKTKNKSYTKLNRSFNTSRELDRLDKFLKDEIK